MPVCRDLVNSVRVNYQTINLCTQLKMFKKTVKIKELNSEDLNAEDYQCDYYSR